MSDRFHNEVVFAGFGGQGLLTAGKLLAQAGMAEGLQVAWVPSYGPEMRGGTASCTVVLDSVIVGSPIVPSPMNAVVMNLPSMKKFAPEIKPGGVLVINSSLIEERSDRTDILQVPINCNDIAIEVMGNSRSANMAALGAIVGATDMISYESIETALRNLFAKKPKLVEPNVEILKRGYEIGRAAREKAAQEG